MGTTPFKLADDIEFVVNADGSKELRNYAVVPVKDEDFDFVGGADNNVGNVALHPVIDPSELGRTVDLVFKDLNLIPRVNLSEADFEQHKKDVITVNLLDKGAALLKDINAIEDLKERLFSSGSKPIRFLDSSGHPIIYGSNFSDSISGYVTPSGTNLDQDEYNVGGVAGVSTLGWIAIYIHM